ncbi:unnamed protein product, partial [marine sediment metagenome]
EEKSKIEKAVNRHHFKYFYLKNLWLGSNGIYSKNYFFNLAKSLAKEKISPDEKIRKINRDLKRIKKEKEKLFKELKISKKYKDLFSVYSNFMLTKIYRRYAQIFWAYQMKNLLKETGKRLGLKLDEARYMMLGEIKEGLLNSEIDKEDIKKRLDFCFYYIEKNKEFISTDKNHFVLTQLKSTKQEDVKELKGQVGCLGKAKGIVKIVNTQQEIAKMKSCPKALLPPSAAQFGE